ncbi:MAG: glycine dehydrogenase (aminomethyl-transferring) [Alphaproteobacteria bacterium]|nr:MAG: glycine dehydrogenase (aminomethyl-transferring) [Alphaproteobacteria bacterium]
MTISNTDLKQDSFDTRHIGPDAAETSEMLEAVGVDTLDALVRAVVPQSIYVDTPLDLPDGLSEYAALKKLRGIAGKNKMLRSFIGMGYTDTVTPPVILRNVLENPGWYTAYTPYQPEISQGRLEALLNYQQVIIDLTGLDIANSSLLDEGTAAAEAMTMARRVGKSKSDVLLVDENCHPQTIDVLKTRSEPLGITLEIGAPESFAGKDGFAVLLQYPDTTGAIADYRNLTDAVHDKGGLVIVAADLLALTLLTPPGEWGADIVVGSAQRFGVPMGFGGPHAAFFATRDDYKRSVPGRIVGVSVDAKGRPALRLALQTREQHIRREKATSNICTAQVLLANIAGFYAVWHGAEGLTRIAKRIHNLTALLAKTLQQHGIKSANEYAFDTLTFDLGSADAEQAVLERGVKQGINLRGFGDGRIGVTLDQKTDLQDITLIAAVIADKDLEIVAEAASLLPQNLLRQSKFLTHPVFSKYRSETEMLRYLRRLEQKDIALNRSMIPLGSCTMKLNAAAEMMPVTWPEFCDMHPFVPQDQAAGYREMIAGLEEMLCKITGFAAVSLQPNAGSQGEYAGLLTIRAYHHSRGETHRNICLIPSSAHGTNPASAVMAGMNVVVVKCDQNGNIDLDDLRAKAEKHKDDLAALMVTYPSTHGVFEEGIVDICDIVHDYGGQVYMDGANMNALVGVAYPGKFGADVAHLNLHKTFCIPHGGGGPGVGPIGVAAHLAPFLPGSAVVEGIGGAEAVSSISAAPFGSAGILAITWMYIVMMGGEGLRRATELAILNANYIAKKLSDHYSILYTGKGGFVAHECILDTRRIHTEIGVSVESIAKRLMDFGFHAPTMSFPVPHTLMVEPTESESKEELDRFIAAMSQIRAEITQVENGDWAVDDNPLANAPHTFADLLAEDWSKPYSRETGAFPLPHIAEDKYWPPVSRIDNAAGDRNLVCTCPPLEAYETPAGKTAQDAA